MQTQKEGNQQRDDEVYSALIRYLEQGLSVIPVGVTKKVPCIEWLRFQRELPTEDDVEEWFRAFSGFNVGMVTGAISGVIVIDADTPDAVAFCKANGLTSPIRVRTRKGMHYYWKHPGGGQRFACKHHNAVSGKGFMDFPHLDFKGDGGYVVLPPSISRKPDGSEYRYEWEFDLDWDDMPVWRGTPSLVDATAADPDSFVFGALNLTDNHVSHPDDFLPVRERMVKRVRELGRKMGDGDGRNQALIQYAGEQVRKGVVGSDLEAVCRSFMEDFFLVALDDREFLSVVRSAVQMDMRNHAGDYRADGTRLNQVAVVAPAAPAVRSRLLTAADVDGLISASATVPWLCDPWLRRGSISQVFAYTGHGKSIFTLGACWHLALPKTDHAFGPFDIPGPARVLYFDWENSRNTLAERMDLMKRSYGDPGDRLHVWSQSILAKDTGLIHLLSRQGLDILRGFVDETQPDVVVIDTIRSAFEGMKENDADAWSIFNRVVTALRNEGRTVIALHHANKPNELGLGREAGSTNQLTAIEVQIRLTPLFRDEEVAKTKVGKAAPATLMKLDAAMAARARAERRADPRIISAVEISYGKNREANENTITRAMAFCEDDDGRQFIVSELSPKQTARELAARGNTVDQIAAAFQTHGHTISKRSIRGWIERRPD